MAKIEDVYFDNQDTLKWYRSSAAAERGFCGRCGSGLFWHELGAPYYSIAAGSVDEPTGLKLACHGWTAEAADYWDFSPDVPQRSGPSDLGLPQELP